MTSHDVAMTTLWVARRNEGAGEASGRYEEPR
jgi:hypothetical protein